MTGRIAINGRFLGRPVSGVERYGREVLAAWDALLLAEGSSLDVCIVAPRGVQPAMELRAIRLQTAGRLQGHPWEQTELFAATRQDVLVSLANCGPVSHPRHLAVIHDAAVFRFPENYSWRYRTLHRLVSRRLAARARLATVSAFSRGELAETLGVPVNAVLLAPNGSEHLGRTDRDPYLIEKLGLACSPFFLTVGTASRNKNLGLVFDAWRRMSRGGDAKLVVVGPVDDRIFSCGLRAADLPGVLFVGRVSDAELATLYGHARAFVFASRYEGFGIPPLEAIAHGCPVLAASIPAVREVCGQGVQYFDPDDARGLSLLMQEAITQRRVPPPQARERLAHYRWADTAAILHDAALELALARRSA